MRLKLALREGRSASRDVLVTADVTASVGELARRLSGADETSEALTLRVCPIDGVEFRLLNPFATVRDAGLRSGCAVEVVRASGSAALGGEAEPAAVLNVTSGPHAGERFLLAAGANTVGRAPTCQVALPEDREVSRINATVTVGDVVTVADMNSANGLVVDGQFVQKAIVASGSVIRVGLTEFRVELLPRTGGSVARDPADFSRSPRVEPAYRGSEVSLPETPSAGDRQKFPLLAVLSPLLLGVGLFAVTRQPYTLIFIALSPVIMLATWLDGTLQTRRKRRADQSRFEESLADVEQRLSEAHADEIAARLAEAPSAQEVRDAMMQRSSLLWTRKPEHSTFLEVRFGLGTQPSRTRLTLPARGSGSVADWERLTGLCDEYRTVSGVPVVEQLERAGSIGIAGPVGAVGKVGWGLLTPEGDEEFTQLVFADFNKNFTSSMFYGDIAAGLRDGIGATGAGYDTILTNLIEGGQRLGYFHDGTAHLLGYSKDGAAAQLLTDKPVPVDSVEIMKQQNNSADTSARALGNRTFTKDGLAIVPTDSASMLASLDQLDAGGGSSMAVVRVITVYGADGTPSGYEVLIPSTKVWGPVPGATPNDLTSDFYAMRYGDQTALAGAVYQAMRNAHIPTGAGAPPVTMAGFSLGGITAAAIASDPSNGYNITHVVAAGSPIADMPIPSHVKVTEFVQNQDIVPTLGGASNPTASNWQTVYVNAPTLPGESAASITPLGKQHPAHSAIRYALVAQQSDADNAVSLPAGATASVTDYYAVR